MSKFFVAKKVFENSETTDKQQLLVSKRVAEISTSDKLYFSTIKKFIETPVVVSTKVEYTRIDGGEHFICVIYRKDSSTHSGYDI